MQTHCQKAQHTWITARPFDEQSGAPAGTPLPVSIYSLPTPLTGVQF